MKIAMLSDSVLTPTGYANVTLELLTRLQEKGHECFNLAHNYQGASINKTIANGKEITFTIIGAGNQPYFKDRMKECIDKYKFDVIIILLDTFMIKENPYNLSFYEQFDFTPCKTVFYYPSDGRNFPFGCDKILRKVDLPVAMSKYGQAQVKELFNIDTKYIPHGVNFKNFFKLEDKESVKRGFGFQNKFIVGVVARNQGRKMLDRTILAFAKFAEDKNNALLFLHLDPNDAASVFDMTQLIKEYKIENKVRFSGMKVYEGFTLERMNQVYNCMDCFLLTTSGEGFGIPTIEAMACGVPVVLTDYTTSAELTNDGKCGMLVPLSTEILGTWSVFRALIDIDKTVESLNKLYIDEKFRNHLGEMGRLKVKNEYDWIELANEWDVLLKELIS